MCGFLVGLKEGTQASVRVDLYHLLCFSMGGLLTLWTCCFFIWRNHHIHSEIFITTSLSLLNACSAHMLFGRTKTYPHTSDATWESSHVSGWDIILEHQTQHPGHGWYLVKGLKFSGILPGKLALKKKILWQLLCCKYFKQQFHIHALATGSKNF